MVSVRLFDVIVSDSFWISDDECMVTRAVRETKTMSWFVVACQLVSVVSAVN